MNAMKRQDDRSHDQKKTHTLLVTATDRFMSNWGGAGGGASKVAWACKDRDQADMLYAWVSARSEMKYVGMTDRPWYPRNAAHVHIYVVSDTHPAL